jgi:adenine-specific DNA-methyltransferase
MGRNYIGIEVGEHAATHCVERMRQVIAGESGGVSSDLNWSGGGAFRFFKLCNADAAPLIDVSKRVGVIAASRRKKSLENKIDADPLRTRAF